MDFKISRSSTKFRYGFSELEQLKEFMDKTDAVGVSFIGRSNVGKSSTINALFGKNTARISKTPGRTREINIFTFGLETEGKLNEDIPEFYLFDLPGYGHAQVSKNMQQNWDELMHHFFVTSSNKMLMLNLQDARHPMQKSDIEFRDYLAPSGHHTFMVFNKLDKLKTQKERAALNKLKPAIFKECSWVKQIHFVSAEKGQGIETLESAIINFLLLQNEVKKRNRT